jgi:hypothetical protein
MEKERGDESQFTTKIGGRTTLGGKGERGRNSVYHQFWWKN